MTDKSGSRPPKSPEQEWTPPDLYEARITVTRDSFAELLKKFDLDVGCRPHVHPNADGTGTLTAFATPERIREIEAAGYLVETGENVSELGRRRQSEVGHGDRFEGGRVVPQGLGSKQGREPRGGSTQ